MEERMRRRALVFSWTGAAVLLAALAAANLLSYVLFARADARPTTPIPFRAGPRNSCAASKTLLTVKVYYTAGLPPPYGLDRQYLRDLLAEYKSAGRGRVQVEFIDPEGESAAARRWRPAWRRCSSAWPATRSSRSRNPSWAWSSSTGARPRSSRSSTASRTWSTTSPGASRSWPRRKSRPWAS